MSEKLKSSKISQERVISLLKLHHLVTESRHQGPSDLTYGNIVADTRLLKAGDIFIAIRGEATDGHRYLPLALASGAAMLVVESNTDLPPDCLVPVITVTSSRAAWSVLSAETCGNPQNELTLIGVTGTNGKTSTTWMVGELLRASGQSCLCVGTLGADFGQGPVPGQHTTPDPNSLYPLMAKARDMNISYIAMEVSSHAIAQEKLFPARFKAMAFTSFSRDHLDFHKTMDAYGLTKLRAFSELCYPDAAMWVAKPIVDSKYDWAAWPHGIKVYGIETAGPSQAAARITATGLMGTTIDIVFESNTTFHLRIPYFGQHAVENFLAAFCLVKSVIPTFDPTLIASANLRPVPGRLERVGQDPLKPTVIVDYAHTPDALEKALTTLRPLTKGNLVVVFGCGGNRDRGKRPQMGQIAQALADRVIVTSDNPRFEDPEEIIREISMGFSNTNKLCIEQDRAQAIKLAISCAQTEDTILVAGKGHESYQIVGKDALPFDDRLISNKFLAEWRP